MTRLLLFSNDRVGRTMSGPGIRYYHVARELASQFEVTLMIPNEPELEITGVRVVRTTELRRELERHDAVFAQHLPHDAMRRLARGDTRVVYDLYVPYLTEGLGMLDGQPGPELHWRAATLVQRLALATGNAFVCASERQRDLWLGMLGVLGRIDPELHASDASLRSLIDVVPFGLPAEPPVAEKASLPGTGEGDCVLLWAGGIWNWLDPLTPIDAVSRLSRRRDDVKLVFLGARHPDMPEMDMARRAVELATELGALDRHVFFERRWIPYEDRASYLLAADVGVSAHFDSIETRYAFRTRLLDHFWARLPTITTGGDVLGDLVAKRGLGRALEPEDVDGWVRAIEELLDDDEERRRIGEGLEAVRAELAWQRVVEPLARLLREPGAPVPARLVSARLEAERLGLRLRMKARGLG